MLVDSRNLCLGLGLGLGLGLRLGLGQGRGHDNDINLTFNQKNTGRGYSITPPAGQGNNVWLTSPRGDGGDFPAEEVSDVIFNALDKYFN